MQAITSDGDGAKPARAHISRSRSIVPEALLVLTSILFGWSIRDEYLINAEYGIGYAMGITGGIFMLLLLIYPIRKRFNTARIFVLSVPGWFRLHMMLGIIGPLLILYHCNFRLGSTNSNIALASMLLMVSSGLVGRFIYSKIHNGLFGRKVELGEYARLLHKDKEQIASQGALGSGVHLDSSLIDWLHQLEQSLQKNRGISGSFLNANLLFIKTRLNSMGLKRRLIRAQENNTYFSSLTKSQQKRLIKNTHDHIREYLHRTRKVSEFRFYERLFSLWHMLHLPIFFMLILSGFAHVYAVHVY